MKRIFKITALVLVAAICIIACMNTLNIKTVADGDLYNCRNFYSTPDNTMDVIVYGSSHAFCSVNPAYLWDNYGIAAYNFSAACQNVGNTYSYIKESLKTQKPKLMLVECFYFANTGYGEGNLYQNTLMLKYSKNYIDNLRYALRVPHDTNESFTDLFIKFPVIHGRYKELNRADFEDYMSFTRGYRVFTDHIEQEIPESVYSTNRSELNEEKKMYLDKMIDLAQENNIPIIFFVSPYILGTDHMDTYNAMEDYLASRGIPFINFNKPDNYAGIDYSSDFIESSHLNYLGANKLTEFLGAYININYSLEGSHDGDARYTDWDKDSEYYHSIIDWSKIAEAATANELSEALNNANNRIILLYNPNNISEAQYGFLKSINALSEDDVNRTGLMIINNKSLEETIAYSDTSYYDLGYEALTYGPLEEGICRMQLHGNGYTDSENITCLIYDSVKNNISLTRTIDENGDLN